MINNPPPNETKVTQILAKFFRFVGPGSPIFFVLWGPDRQFFWFCGARIAYFFCFVGLGSPKQFLIILMQGGLLITPEVQNLQK